MDTFDVRLECLRLAEKAFGADADKVTGIARKYADFILGTRDAEIIDAARVLASTIADQGS